MGSIERRISALEAPLKRAGPYANLSDIDLDAKINRLCIAAGTTLEQEVAKHGSRYSFLESLQKELVIRCRRI